MGLNRMMPPANLLDPTGSFKPQLRSTVHDALLTTRFDSVSSVSQTDRQSVRSHC